MKFAAFIILAVLMIGFAAWRLCYPPGGIPRARPELPRLWSEQFYSLDDDEVERFIPPPHMVQRINEIKHYRGPFPFNGLKGQLSFFITPPEQLDPDRLTPMNRRFSSETGTIASAFGWCNDVDYIGRDLPQALEGVIVDGDWLVRQGVPMERRMKAVESILRDVTKRNIVIDNRSVERDVILVKGEWKFCPLDGADATQRTGVQLFSDQLDMPPARILSTDFTQFLGYVEGVTDRKVINEIQKPPTTNVSWSINNSGRQVFKSEEKFAALLQNLQKQTSLEFVRTKRIVPVWFIRERAVAEQPNNGK